MSGSSKREPKSTSPSNFRIKTYLAAHSSYGFTHDREPDSGPGITFVRMHRPNIWYRALGSDEFHPTRRKPHPVPTTSDLHLGAGNDELNCIIQQIGEALRQVCFMSITAWSSSTTMHSFSRFLIQAAQEYPDKRFKATGFSSRSPLILCYRRVRPGIIYPSEGGTLNSLKVTHRLRIQFGSVVFQ
jgi:hypothetical protein